MPAIGAALVTGATGLVGGQLVAQLLERGVAVRAATRSPTSPGRLELGAEPLGWDGTHLPDEALADSDAVIHLSGEPIFAGPLTASRRRRVRESRVASTRSLAEKLAALPPGNRPSVWVSASAVGYYGSRGETKLDESAAAGSGFLADVCREWEAATLPASEAGVRVVNLRIGIVMAREGGALAMMARPFRLGLGGRLGDGRQWVPWIHADDLTALACRALEDPRLAGPVNAVAPGVVRNAELTRVLADTLGRPAFLPAPAFVLRGLLGELAEELLGSRRVIPARAEQAEFAFRYPDLGAALAAELGSVGGGGAAGEDGG